MLSPRWKKVLRDVIANPTRTILVVLSIAVGVFAINMVNGSQAILSRELTSAYLAVNPADATLYTVGFDDELVQSVRNVDGVLDAQGKRSLSLRLRVGPDAWKTLSLTALEHYDTQQINLLRPEQGAWPPPERELVIERASLGLTNARVGDMVEVELPNGTRRQMRIAGTVYDLSSAPVLFTQQPAGYIAFETLDWLGDDRSLNAMDIRVREELRTPAGVAEIAKDVRRRIENSGRIVFWTYLPEPGKHPADLAVQSLLVVLSALGGLSVFASGFLVVNTISALLAQHLRQIGVLKSIGATSGAIAMMYMLMVLLYGALALLIAIPAASYGASDFSTGVARFFNTDIVNAGVPADVVLLHVAVGLIVPMVAGLQPVLAGSRITVLQALNSAGSGADRVGWFDRLLARIRGLPRPLMLSLRNTFRRKGRLLLTLLTLTMSGLIFISVFSVRESMLLTLDDAFKYFNYDIQISMNRGYRVSQLQSEALKIPGVTAAEAWGFNGVRRLRPNDTESDNFVLFAPPAETQMIIPTMVEGRWLKPGDANALVINTNVTRTEPDLKVGSTVTLRLNNRDTQWTVVGIARAIGGGSFMYATYDAYTVAARENQRAAILQVQLDDRSAANQTRVGKLIEDHFRRIGLDVGAVQPSDELRRQNVMVFDIIINFLLMMAILLAVVGGIGLMGTMSINVIERTREIGVLRAIGASEWAIMTIVVTEGVLIGVLSWILGAIFSVPVSQLICAGVGMAIFQTPLSFVFSTNGLVLWLGLVVVLASIASILPARNASRLTVREVLAYDG